MEKTKVAGYCRVSTHKDDQAGSFEAQCRYFREYIERNEQWMLADIYADEGVTGTSTKNRVRFNQMIADAREGKFRLILTKEVSRFSRNILDTIRYTRELKEMGVGVIFMTDGICTLDPDAELRLSIMGSIAQEESRKTSARVKWGQTRQMERGVVFGHSMLGYDIKDGKMTVNPAEAVIVERIFRQYALEGMSAAAIAQGLERDRIHTRSGSPVWRPSYIIKVLKNEKYAGDLVQKKSVTPDYLSHRKKYNKGEEPLIVLRDHYVPIVTRDLWNAAQERRQNRGRRK